MAPSLKATHRQENYFFDGPSQELTSKHGVLRVRFYDIDRKALVTLKGRQQLEGGVGRGTEVEFCADPAEARRWLTSPAGLLAADSDVVRSAKAEYGLTDLVCMGGFKNLRQDYAFEGHTLELDETTFDHGTVHEIEVESASAKVGWRGGGMVWAAVWGRRVGPRRARPPLSLKHISEPTTTTPKTR